MKCRIYKNSIETLRLGRTADTGSRTARKTHLGLARLDVDYSQVIFGNTGSHRKRLSRRSSETAYLL